VVDVQVAVIRDSSGRRIKRHDICSHSPYIVESCMKGVWSLDLSLE
jgi:hypothetical protein